MNQKTLPTSRRKVRSISTTSSGPRIVGRASALAMDETLPHFVLRKSANLQTIRRFQRFDASIKHFDISHCTALDLGW